ncbi:uncharacterized protein [Dysidea avara]|uniref:uncharacterized protein n=1 Tax=Dysidea avara TaxID=196820 RepID=UPI003329157C
MDDVKCFPVTSLFDFHYYHPYGNTPPDDLLQSITTDTPQPDVLLLGCGDLRSCLYTLWNNFDHRHARKFKGVHFVLNDTSAAVLARNVIFLYLCTQMPASHDDKVKWVASFWAIWYCHELLPHHKEVLMDALSNLLRWSESVEYWTESKDNPLRLLVRFPSVTSISLVHKAWKKWYNDAFTVKEMKNNRSMLFKSRNTDILHSPMDHLHKYFGSILLQNFSESERKQMKLDVRSYFKNGSAFGEEVLNLPAEKATSVNSTFIDRPDGKYNLPCGLIPYNSFFFTYQLSPKNLNRLKYSDFSLMVSDDKFVHKPLLANSIQQFSVWVRSSAEILRQAHHDIAFTFQCSDAVEFCQQLLHSHHPHLPCLFDAIYSSNLIDYIAPPSLVLLSMLVLKSDGILFTSVFYYYATDSNTCKEFLQRGFGLDCKCFQLLCGVRCLGYENEYSDLLTIKPVFVSDVDLDTIIGVGVRSLMWQHVTMTPLKQVTDKTFTLLWSTLSAAIAHMLTFQHNAQKSPRMINCCTGTIMVLLQSFALQFDRKEYDCTSYQFWKPLCSLLLNQQSLEAFLVSLQTQALLCNLHLHLMVSGSTCPFCSKRAVLDVVSQCSILVPKPTVHRDGNFRLLVYDESLCTELFYNNFSGLDHIDGIHIIDTIAVGMSNENLVVDFFILDRFLQKNYYLTVLHGNTCLLPHKQLSDFEAIESVDYSFKKLELSKTEQSCANLGLGTIIQHSGDDSHFETIIGLNDQVTLALNDHQLTTVQSSDTNIELRTDDYLTNISYPYSINYSTMQIKLSRRNKKITVTAYRKRHSIHDEKPVFIVNPDNMLSLPVMYISGTDAKQFCEFSLSFNQFSSIPLQNFKATFATMFHDTTQQFFALTFLDQEKEGIHTKYFIAILNRVFDVHNKTPAIDMLFWDTTEKGHPHQKLKWPNAIPLQLANDAEEKLARKTFNYFAKCTATTMPLPKENSAYQYLLEHKIEQYFTRAVIYPLYPNADERTANQDHRQLFGSFLYNTLRRPLDQHRLGDVPTWFLNFKSFMDEDNCSYCKHYSEDLRKCSQCRLVQYCNRTCQQKHWKVHQPTCTRPPECK